MNHISKLEFVDTIFDRIPSNASNDFAERVILDFLRDHVPSGKLYKYRSVTEHSLSNLKEGTLYCAKPSSFNDPFDCQIGLNIRSYFLEVFNQELSPVESYLKNFKKVYLGELQISNCSEHEQLVFKEWQNSKNLMPFLVQCFSDNPDPSHLETLLLDNFNIAAELMLPILLNQQLRDQMSTSLNLFPNLLSQMTPEGKLLITKENASYADFARGLGINEDVDEITLTSLMYQAQRPSNPSAAIKTDADLAQISAELKNVMDQAYRVGCLCTDYKNRLMWSHYADGHKGFCIEYDFSVPWEGDSKALLLPVIYSSERPIFPWSVVLAADKNSDVVKADGARAMVQSLVTKDAAWQYEDEWRIITLQSTGVENIIMPPISCIYVGALCPDDDKAQLIEIAQAHSIPIKQMTIDRGCYALHASILL